MIRTIKMIAISLSFLAVSACSTAEVDKGADGKRPNILLVVVDDMGMADLGSFGGEIDTPNLDQLAYDGIRLTNFHASPVCSVTRSMLLTGTDAHKAGMGNMAEELAPNQKGQPGHEGKLSQRVVTVASLLRDAGYHTYLTGKWHLGKTQDAIPVTRGFDRSFSLLTGGASHFIDMKPAYSEDPNAVAPYQQDDKRLDRLPQNFEYSSQFYVDQMIEYLETDKTDERPFFAYLSFTAPHWPLQAPDEAVTKYAGRYDQGFDILRKQRLKKQIEMGIIPPGTPENQKPPKGRDWDELSDQEKAAEKRAMEIYAAMIDQIDFHMGRMIRYLKDSDEFENTIIIFISDNGAEGHDIDNTFPGDLFPEMRANIDNQNDFSFANMGKPNSYVFYGPNWARAGAPSFRLHKGFPTEGGIRVPAFIHYERFPKSKISNRFLTVQDITPTLLELADVSHPAPTYQGRNVEPMTGTSMLKAFTDEAALGELGWRIDGGEVMGKYYIRKGPWKMVHMEPPFGNGEWQLYNMEDDPGERSDLSGTRPEIRNEMIEEWKRYASTNNVIIPDWVSGY